MKFFFPKEINNIIKSYDINHYLNHKKKMKLVFTEMLTKFHEPVFVYSTYTIICLVCQKIKLINGYHINSEFFEMCASCSADQADMAFK